MTKIEILWKFQGKVNPRLRLWKEYINFVCKKLKIKFDYMFFTKVWQVLRTVLNTQEMLTNHNSDELEQWTSEIFEKIWIKLYSERLR